MTFWDIVRGIGHHLGGFGFLASALLLLVPLFGALGGALASWMVASRNVYINSITAQRSLWLEKLRNSITSFESAVETHNYRASVVAAAVSAGETPTVGLTTKEFYEDSERITLLANTVHLQLNPDGEIDKNILALVDAMSKWRNSGGREMVAATYLLTSHAQWLLKAEWEKVKWEAGGTFYRFHHRGDERVRKAAYKVYNDDKGSTSLAIESLKQSVLSANRSDRPA